LCRAEGSQRFQQRCGETTFYFYAFSLRSVKGKACGSFVASPIFYFFYYTNFEVLFKNQTASLKTAATAASTFIL
jgi:hypothetical protein